VENVYRQMACRAFFQFPIPFSNPGNVDGKWDMVFPLCGCVSMTWSPLTGFGMEAVRGCVAKSRKGLWGRPS